MILKIIKTCGRGISIIMDDALLIAGFILITYGGAIIYRPAGFIISGICFIAFAYLVAKRR